MTRLKSDRQRTGSSAEWKRKREKEKETEQGKRERERESKERERKLGSECGKPIVELSLPRFVADSLPIVEKVSACTDPQPPSQHEEKRSSSEQLQVHVVSIQALLPFASAIARSPEKREKRT